MCVAWHRSEHALNISVAMGSTAWSSAAVSFSSGFSYSTQSACESLSHHSEQVLSCVPMTVSITRNDAPPTRRALDITPTLTPFSAGVQLSLPAALLTNLGAPGSYAVLRNTDQAAYADSSSPCSMGSTAAEYSAGTVNAVLCAAGTYSIRIVAPAAAPVVTIAPTSNSTASRFSSPAVIAGVIVGAMCAVMIALVAVRAVTVRRRDKVSSDKVVPASSPKKGVTSQATPRAAQTPKVKSPRSPRDSRALTRHSSNNSASGRTPRSAAVQPVGWGGGTPKAAIQTSSAQPSTCIDTTVDDSVVQLLQQLERASGSVSARHSRSASPLARLAWADAVHQLAIEGPKLAPSADSSTQVTQIEALAPKPSLYNLALRNVASSALSRPLSAPSKRAAFTPQPSRIDVGSEVAIATMHSLGDARAQTPRAAAQADTAAQRLLDSLIEEIREAEAVSQPSTVMRA